MTSSPVNTSSTGEQQDLPIPTELYHDEEEQEERPAHSEGEEEETETEAVTVESEGQYEQETELDGGGNSSPQQQQQQAGNEGIRRGRMQSNNSYEASVVSTQSAPPPYELYPPAKTVFGRIYNWLRKIPRLNTHQAIYLPTFHDNDGENESSGRSIFSLRSRRRGNRQHRRSESQSALSTTSSIDSSNSVSCWSYYYFAITDRLPELPRFVLPSFLAQRRIALISISCFSLVLFSFLLFCSIFFSPITYPDPIYPDKVTNSTARFLTLNIFMRPPLIKNNWSDFKDDRLDYIEKYILPEYDVITFQESFAFASRRKDRLITTARNMGFNYHVESPRKYPWNIGVDGGLLLISRFPIRESNVIEYPRGQHSDWISIKGALHALIELNPNRKMHLYTTHTQASYDLNNIINEDDTAIRLSQFSLLHNFIYDTAHSDNEPVMVVGDLNVDAATHPKDAPITRPSKESSPEYIKMVNVIKGTGVKRSNSNERWFEHSWKIQDLTDIVYDKYGYHPVTFGDYMTNDQGELIPAETVLTNWDVLMTVQSIDRIFWSDRDTHRVQLASPRVEKFWVSENNQMTDEEKANTGFTQISDHYGVSCEIQVI